MKENYLNHALPVLANISENRRKQFEDYFRTAPVWLIESFVIEEMEKGTIFIREGEPVDTIYFIISGAVKATDYRIYGITYDFMMIRRKVYAYGGMEVIMDIEKYRTTIQTVTDCVVLKIPKTYFKRWLLTDIVALKKESKLMAEYLLEEARENRAFLFLQGSDRLAFLLQRNYEKYSVKGVLRMNGSRKALSDSTGLCQKTINRAVKKFEESGWITLDKREIVINQEQYPCLKDVVTEILAEDE